MPIDLKDPEVFQFWRDIFLSALEGAAGSGDPRTIVASADVIAQAAVELIEKRRKDVTS
jgi:hypothetical protein